MSPTNRDRAPSVRQLRVGEQIRHSLSEVLTRGDLHEPALREMSSTVSEVRVSPDLRNATVFVMPLGGSAVEAALEALTRAAAYLRNRIGKDLRLRYLPNLSFRRDPAFDAATRIDEILRSPDVVRDLDQGGGSPASDRTPDRAGDRAED
jgi:ribosome-binding factor A